MRGGWVAAAALGVCAVAASAVWAQGPYRVLTEWKVGGEGGWDYLLADGPAHRLYLTHNARVEVVDTETGKPVGAVTGLKSTHGIALDPDGKTGYASDGAGNAVVVFDRTTLQVLATIPAGINPDAILFEPATKTVWAFNGRSKNISVIDAASRAIVATIAVAGKPEFAQADGNGNVFVNLEDRNSIVHLDATQRALVATWPLKECESPSGLALDREHSRLFAVCDGDHMAVVDAHSGSQIATANIGADPDAAGYDARHQLAFSSNGGDGTLSVVDAAHGYKTLQTLNTRKGARTLAYDATTDRVYLVAAEFGPKPAPTAAVPKPRATIVPGSFSVLVVGR